MIKHCTTHSENLIHAVCLYEGCTQVLICLQCMRTHPKEHDTFTYETYDLSQNKNWVEKYEKERDILVNHENDIYDKKAQLIGQYRGNLNAVSQAFIKSIEDHEKTLITEFNEMLESEEARNLSSDLEKDLTILQNINFRQGDDFDKVWIIKDFLEKNKPTTRSLINLGFEVLNGWALDETKVNLYKDELIKLLNSIHLRNLLVAVPFRSIHDTDAITAIKDEKADLEMQLKDALERAKTREEEIEKLKGDNMHITHERDNMKVELEHMKLKLVETDTHYTQRIEELMKKIPVPATPATPRGSRK